MSQEGYVRGSLALVIAQFFPPLVRDAVLADVAFAANLALASNATVTLNPAKVSFKRSVLFDTIREASKQPESSRDVTDEVGQTWTLKFEREQAPVNLSISSDSTKFFVSHLGVLSEIQDERVEILDSVAARVNLTGADYDGWASLISQRPLTDDEVSAFGEDINATPAAVADAISNSLNSNAGSLPLDLLVPRSVQYYERLAGCVGEQHTIKEYASEVLNGHMRQLLHWRKDEGLRHCLLLCSHPLAVEVLGEEDIDGDTVARTLKWAAKEGDAMARCASLELGLFRADAPPETIAGLVEVASALRVVKGEPDQQFQMFSAAFVMVYGQLAHTKIIASKPLFWRRLAAFAQTALITRCMVSRGVELSETIEVMKNIRSRPYRIQGFADLRLGPLWQSQMANASPLRHEFVGRVVMRSAQRMEFVRSVGLEDQLLGNSTDGLKSSVNLYLAQMPGPLEDNLPLRELLLEDRAIVAAALNEAKPTAQSFIPLVNSAFMFGLPIELAEMAASALRRAQFHIDAQGNRVAFMACIVGLASVAAVTRCIPLADAVFTVIRYYRQFSPSELDLGEAIHAGVTACASHEELANWAAALDNLMSGLAFQDISKQEADGLNLYLLDFCELIPELWASLGPALAATEAVAA
jgi:hypothetical protein